LRGIEIIKADIKKAIVVKLKIPSEVEANGDLNGWSVLVTPDKITGLKPQQVSTVSYTATLQAPGLTFSASSFWDGLVESESTPINGVLVFEPDPKTVETKLTQNLENKVKKTRNLEPINKFVKSGDTQKRTVEIPLTFRIAYNTFWRRAVAGLAALLLLGITAFAVSLISGKSHYELLESGELSGRHLSLPLMGSSPLLQKGVVVARIRNRFGRISVISVPGYAIMRQDAPSVPGENRFVIKNLEDSSQTQYVLRRLVSGKKVTVSKPDDNLFG
jgi:hypothetical protein